MTGEFGEFLNDFQPRVAKLEKGKHEAYFTAAVSGDTASYEKYSQLELEHTRLFSDPVTFRFLEEAKKELAGDLSPEGKLLHRQAEILYLNFKAHQVPSELQEEIIRLETWVEQRFSVFRAPMGKDRLSDNQIEDILETETDDTRLRKAWEASKEIGHLVEEDIRRLVGLRNESARLLGYPHYHHMSLDLSEQSPAETDRIFEELDRLTREPFARIKTEIDKKLATRLNIAEHKLRPWHYQDRFFQEVPPAAVSDADPWYRDQDLVAICRRYFEKTGLPVDDLLSQSDLYEKEGKNQHAFCINIDRGSDIRVLSNVKPSRKWMNTLLHEFGHAVYEKFLGDDLPWFLREPAHIFTTEAVAMYFGRLSSDAGWMCQMGILSEDQARDLQQPLKQAQRNAQLVFSRWAQLMYRFEQSLYAHPDQDLNALWWRLAQKYQRLAPPDDMLTPHWASKIHIATAPCYYHNYLLGELLASQLGESLLPGEQTGKFLREKVFAPGARLHWSRMISQACGSGLSARAYARDFAGAESP